MHFILGIFKFDLEFNHLKESYMIFIIGEDEKENIIINKTSSAGKADQLIFLLEGVQSRIREIARTVIKLVRIIDYISQNVPHQDAVEEYINLLNIHSKSLDDLAKSMESLGVEIQKDNSAPIKMYIPEKNKGRARIQTRQQGCTLKYKRYELRIYSRMIKGQ